MAPRIIYSQDKEREKRVAIHENLFSNPAIRYTVLKASLHAFGTLWSSTSYRTTEADTLYVQKCRLLTMNVHDWSLARSWAQ